MSRLRIRTTLYSSGSVYIYLKINAGLFFGITLHFYVEVSQQRMCVCVCGWSSLVNDRLAKLNRKKSTSYDCCAANSLNLSAHVKRRATNSPLLFLWYFCFFFFCESFETGAMGRTRFIFIGVVRLHETSWISTFLKPYTFTVRIFHPHRFRAACLHHQQNQWFLLKSPIVCVTNAIY